MELMYGEVGTPEMTKRAESCAAWVDRASAILSQVMSDGQVFENTGRSENKTMTRGYPPEVGMGELIATARNGVACAICTRPRVQTFREGSTSWGTL